MIISMADVKPPVNYFFSTIDGNLSLLLIAHRKCAHLLFGVG